eukprot:GCRY01000664.1.p1 GENE.GCRY01000664.1~~GCRY01000664.1.p1  ORF type:complete len:586 (-),score=173.26 GCRY01000664.1:486-2243(-)
MLRFVGTRIAQSGVMRASVASKLFATPLSAAYRNFATTVSVSTIKERNSDVILNPRLNKGSAFTYDERALLGLDGLVLPRQFTQDEQVDRIMRQLDMRESNLEKYVELRALVKRNERLFYRVAEKHLSKVMPLIYTPTVGAACQNFSDLQRNQYGLFISKKDKGNMKQILNNWKNDVDVIVVTDGERILGLGDLGANGMGIPIGKLQLYTACGGVDPSRCLPITLDVGTNNSTLLNSPLYGGVRETRLTGECYDEFVHEFVSAVQERFPSVLLQWEDFANHNAFRLLSKYEDKICSFNDDIQGTASVATAGVFSASRITKKDLKDQRFVFLGAGEAGTGIASLLVSSMVREGVPYKEACSKMHLLDVNGRICKQRNDLEHHHEPFAHDLPHRANLLELITDVKPTCLIGVSGVPRLFSEEVIKTMTSINADSRPVIMALSNPTANAECTAEQCYTWSDNKALFCTGSPFDDIEINGKLRVTGQGNNAYIFPGVGLGVVACKATKVTNDMFFIAAKTLADCVDMSELAVGNLYPNLNRIRECSHKIAVAVAKECFNQGFATIKEPANIDEFIAEKMYDTEYPEYVA